MNYCVQVGGSDEAVMGIRMVLGEVVTKVGTVGFTVHEEFFWRF